MTPDTAAPGMVASLLTTLFALAFVLALAWLVLRLLKRIGAGRAGAGDVDAPQLLRTVPIGPRERLVVVRYRARDYLLAVSAGAICVVDAHPVALKTGDDVVTR